MNQTHEGSSQPVSRRITHLHRSDPGHYVERVDRWTGHKFPGPIRPAELLVSSYRDRHPVDIAGRMLASAIVRHTGDEEKAFQLMKRLRWFARRASTNVVSAVGRGDPDAVTRTLFGLRSEGQTFRFVASDLDEEEIRVRLDGLQAEARECHDRNHAGDTRENGHGKRGGHQIRPLLTGGTGFIGKEIIARVAEDPEITELIVLIRPKIIRDRKTGDVLETLAPKQRGVLLLDELRIDPAFRSKFRFLQGDIEEDDLGLTPHDKKYVADSVTHVVHCAANVSFDDPYPVSFEANVVGSQNALAFSHWLQNAPRSRFVAHLAIETSFIHGRQVGRAGSEQRLRFPHDNYNNYYELTKAIASLETERFMLDSGLRVVQLCPAIVIGHAATGNNRGDTKVVNAPVNAWGRAGLARTEAGKGASKVQASVIASLVCTLPTDKTARMNLVAVDRVAAGIVAALKRPEAVGQRIHLANELHLSTRRFMEIAAEELDLTLRPVDPTLHRVLLLPTVVKLLTLARQARLANAMQRLGSVFVGYVDFGQTVAAVGSDAEILELEDDHDHPEPMVRMLVRHNRFVQRYGTIRESEELAEREARWASFLADLEVERGISPVALSAEEFAEAVEQAGL